MSRPASSYTVAIRTLLDEHGGNLTHAEIRPLLAKKGFNIAVEPPTLSDAFSQFEQYDVKLDDDVSVASAMKACGFDASVQILVLHEAKARANFKSERNNFDVTKYNWNKMKQSGDKSPSRKPVSSKNSKAKMAATVMPRPKYRIEDTPISTTVKRGRGRPPAVVTAPVTASDFLEFVAKNGGVSVVRNRITELRLEADKMESALNAVLDLQKRLSDAA